MNYLIGIDIGTSGTKTVLFDENGCIISWATKEYPLHQPQNGWAEQNPEDWWEAVCKTLKKVTTAIDNPGVIKAIGLSGQMHGLVMLDEQNQVIRPSIIWCDQRTAKECKEITELVGAEKLIDITANPALTGFTASKILWVRNNEPENYKKCRHILLPKDYIRFKLTGEYATDVSDASGMQLLDIAGRCWSDEVLQRLNIDKSLLGKVYKSTEISGRITEQAAKLTGLLAGIIVAGGAGDNAAAAVGTGVVTDGKAFTTIGTSGVVYAHTSTMCIDKKGRVHTFCAAVPGQWHVMGVTLAAGLSLKWFKSQFAENISYEELDELAAKLPIGADRLIYLPYLMGERTPHLNPDCRGVFFGLSSVHGKPHLARAVMEGVAYSMKDCSEILNEMGVLTNDMAVCGGGGKSPLWRQMLSDLYGCQVSTIQQTEGPALGAAILAGVSAGLYPSVPDACQKLIKKDKICTPIPENSIHYTKYYDIYKGLYSDLKSRFNQLSSMI